MTVLTDAEVGLIAKGLRTMTGAVIGTAAKTTTGRAKKVKVPITADQL